MPGCAIISLLIRPSCPRKLPMSSQPQTVSDAKTSSTPISTHSLQQTDPAIHGMIEAEAQRLHTHIGLIASENSTSHAVMEAQGTILTNKYAEGYPGKRYYGGCEHIDEVETLAIDRAKELFGAVYANVQPHSGAQANAAALMALAQPGDTILGMNLAHGGHLTHGSPANFSGKLYKAVAYELDPATGDIDYDLVERQAKEHRPRVLIAGFSAFSGIPDWARFRAIADEVGAMFMVDMAHVAGLIAAGCHPSPLLHAHVVTSTTHKTLRGPRGGLILSGAADADLHKKLNSAVFPGTQGGPLQHIIAAKAVCFLEAMRPAFRDYQRQIIVNAQVLAQSLIERGYDVVSGGTKVHLFLLSLIGRECSGKAAEAALGRANITLNKNAVPNDPRSPFVTSGLRIGTPMATSRGFTEPQMQQIGGWIADVLDELQRDPDSIEVQQQVQQKVVELCAGFPHLQQ